MKENMPINRFSLRGFTLIELMISIVIIGILSIIAVPAFQKYKLEAYTTEAYTNLDAIAKAEISYFLENEHFTPLAVNPGDFYIDWDNRAWQTGESGWGFPYGGFPEINTLGTTLFAAGAKPFFNYAAAAGTNDGQYDAMAGGKLISNGAADLSTPVIPIQTTNAQICVGYKNSDENELTLSPADFGLANDSTFHWALLSAQGGFHLSDKCRFIFMVLRAGGAQSDAGPKVVSPAMKIDSELPGAS